MIAADDPFLQKLPELRGDLRLEKAGRAPDGSPLWLIDDPLRGQFFHIGLIEHAVLSNWQFGNVQDITKGIVASTHFPATPEMVGAICRKLMTLGLTLPQGREGNQRLIQEYDSQKKQKRTLAFDKLIFFKQPLFNPQAFLLTILPYLRLLLTKQFLALSCIAGLLGFALAMRHWDFFISQFMFTITPEGALTALLLLIVIKCIHELAHGLMAVQFGVRVRKLGFALFIFAPMLYTDVTEAWRLRDRWKRVVISAAGVLAEFQIGCWALLLWNFLPDGQLRSVCFSLASISFLMTVFVNFNPVIRFDGYYIISDFLEQPNLQTVAHRLALKRFRSWLAGQDDPTPVDGLNTRHKLAIEAYAYWLWFYRFFLLLGIAATLYHFSFKLAGLFLGAVAVFKYFVFPFLKEAYFIIEHYKKTASVKTLLRVGLIISAAIFVLLYPWRTSIEADGLFLPEKRFPLIAPSSGQILKMNVKSGQNVQAGDLLFELKSIEKAQELAITESKIVAVSAQIRMLEQQRDSIARAETMGLERQALISNKDSLLSEMALNNVRAPFDGKVVDLEDGLRPGEFVAKTEPLALLVSEGPLHVEVFIPEEDIRRVALNAPVKIYNIGSDGAFHRGRVVSVDETAIRELPEVALSSTVSGPIAARTDQHGALIPELALYRVRIAVDGGYINDRITLVKVKIEAPAISLADKVWRRIVGVVVRESGF